MEFTGSYLTHLELQLALKCSSVPRQWVLSGDRRCQDGSVLVAWETTGDAVGGRPDGERAWLMAGVQPSGYCRR